MFYIQNFNTFQKSQYIANPVLCIGSRSDCQRKVTHKSSQHETCKANKTAVRRLTQESQSIWLQFQRTLHLHLLSHCRLGDTYSAIPSGGCFGSFFMLQYTPPPWSSTLRFIWHRYTHVSSVSIGRLTGRDGAKSWVSFAFEKLLSFLQKRYK